MSREQPHPRNAGGVVMDSDADDVAHYVMRLQSRLEHLSTYEPMIRQLADQPGLSHLKPQLLDLAEALKA